MSFPEDLTSVALYVLYQIGPLSEPMTTVPTRGEAIRAMRKSVKGGLLGAWSLLLMPFGLMRLKESEGVKGSATRVAVVSRVAAYGLSGVVHPNHVGRLEASSLCS